jgi:ketosteroid isomerase-like protein
VMSESPAAVVRALIERVNAGAIDDALELLARDSVFEIPPEASVEPDTYLGREGARRYFSGFDGMIDDVRFELLDLEQVTDDTVLAEATLRGRGSTTGIQVEQGTFAVLTVRDGLVTWIKPYVDRDAALAAARARAER